MPLITSITRNGRLLPVRWGGFHIAAIAIASLLDSGQINSETMFDGKVYDHETPIAIDPRTTWDMVSYGALSMTPLNKSEYTLTGRYVFRDTTDGEILNLQPGDVLSAVRGW